MATPQQSSVSQDEVNAFQSLGNDPSQSGGSQPAPAAGAASLSKSSPSKDVSADEMSAFQKLKSDSEVAASQSSEATGEQQNEIGKTVIVPKDGESFADTMQRAAVQGRKTTQQDISDEMKTAPRKVAQVLGAAPVIGATGAAGLAAPGEMGGAGEALFHLSESKLDTFAKAYPHLYKLAELTGAGSGVAGAYKIFEKIFGTSK